MNGTESTVNVGDVGSDFPVPGLLDGRTLLLLRTRLPELLNERLLRDGSFIESDEQELLHAGQKVLKAGNRSRQWEGAE